MTAKVVLLARAQLSPLVSARRCELCNVTSTSAAVQAVDSFRQDLATTATTLGLAHTCLLHHIQPCGRRARAQISACCEGRHDRRMAVKKGLEQTEAYMALHAMPEEASLDIHDILHFRHGCC